MGSLTGRERILRTLKHQPVDRVPISTYELVGYDFRSWYNKQPSYKRLMDLIREKTDCLRVCGIRCPNLGEKELRTEEKWREGELRFNRVTLHTPRGDLTGLYRDQDNLLTTWCLEHLLKSVEDLERWLSIPYEPGEVNVESIKQAEIDVGDHGIPFVDIGDPLLVVAELFSFEDFLLHWITEKKKILRAMDVIFERQYDVLKTALERGAGPAFRLVGPEYATPPYVPPEGFRELVVKYDKRLIDLVHQYNGFVRVHCHGRIRKVLPMFVEMGADGADPLEAPPSGDIELAEIKELYGRDIVLFGNMQLRDLEFATPAEIDALVKRCMESAKDAGGYVLMPTASPIDAPLKPETEANYVAFIEAGLKYGLY
jgi:uroporphyrinogen-III decarboxylase